VGYGFILPLQGGIQQGKYLQISPYYGYIYGISLIGFGGH
jgi:hypothetical protein